MPYKWEKHDCNADGVPYLKVAGAWLHKKGEEPKLFMTQATLDEAWANGWHAPFRPETADVSEDEEKDKLIVAINELGGDVDRRFTLENLQTKLDELKKAKDDEVE